MDGKISVIVPVYNVINYLRRCTKSILSQSYENFELILVDDGSTDGSGALCDEIKNESTGNIKVIHKENGGLADARNEGLKAACGDYIVFIDSDDYIHLNMFETLMHITKEHDADIVECCYEMVSGYVKSDGVDVARIKTTVYDAKGALEALINENPIKQVVWNKLYKKGVLEGILFQKGKIHEDEFWTYQVIGKASKVIFADVVLYYYYQREGSIMNQGFSIDRIDGLMARLNRLLYIQKYFPQLEFAAKKNLFFLCIYDYQKAIRHLNDDIKQEACNKIDDILEQISFTKEEMDILSFKDRCWVRIARSSPQRCASLRNLFHIGVS